MIKKPRGTNDIYKSDVHLYEYLNRAFRQVLATYNYDEIITPIFEQKDLFVRGVGDSSDIVTKEMYEFDDRKGRHFVLRPEGTSGVVRAIIENKLYVQNNLPLKLFYTGPMFRYERPQAGRQRQFYQFGLETFGIDSVFQDLEVIKIALDYLKVLRLDEQAVVYVNYLITGASREQYIEDLVTYLQTVPDLCDDCQARMHTNPLRVLDCKIDGPRLTGVPNMQNYLDEAEKTRFHQLTTYLNDLDYEVIVENNLVRGLDYYTGMVFEIKTGFDDNALTLIGGGRYNKLTGQLGGPDLPAAGFALGVERLGNVLKQMKPNDWLMQPVNVYVGQLGTLSFEKWQFVDSLRLLGLTVETNLQEASLKQIFKEAQKNQARKIIILGDNEIKTKVVKIKDQKTGTEVTKPIAELSVQDLV